MSPGSVSHAKKHQINSTKDHKPIPGDHDEDSVIVMDANGLPVKDSGVPISTLLNGMQPMGPWDCSGGTYPVAPDVGDFYWCSKAGTITGTDYEINDWLVYVATSEWKKIDNTESGLTMMPDVNLAGELPDLLDAGFNDWVAGSRGIAIGAVSKRSFFCWVLGVAGPPFREIQFVSLDNALWTSDTSSGVAYPRYVFDAGTLENNTKLFIIGNTGRKFLAFKEAGTFRFVELHRDATNKFGIAEDWLAAPPTPAEEMVILVATGATGGFATHDGQLAIYQNGAWTFITPEEGWLYYNLNNHGGGSSKWLRHDGTNWVTLDGSIDHSKLDKLDWNVAAHNMNTDLDMDSHKVIECTGVEGPAATNCGIEAGTGFDCYSKMGDKLGANSHEFRDSDGTMQAKVNSLGKGQFKGADLQNSKITNMADGAASNDAMAYGQRYTDSNAQAAVKWKPDVTLAGATPVNADVTAWAAGDRGHGIGTGGREFYMVKRGTAVKFVELT